LTAVEPQRAGDVIQGDAPLGERGSTLRDHPETRVNSLRWGGHELAWLGEGRLGDSVVLRLELECQGITSFSVHRCWIVGEGVVSANNYGEGLSRDSNDREKSSGNGRKTHFEQNRQREVKSRCSFELINRIETKVLETCSWMLQRILAEDGRMGVTKAINQL